MERELAVSFRNASAKVLSVFLSAGMEKMKAEYDKLYELKRGLASGGTMPPEVSGTFENVEKYKQQYEAAVKTNSFVSDEEKLDRGVDFLKELLEFHTTCFKICKEYERQMCLQSATDDAKNALKRMIKLDGEDAVEKILNGDWKKWLEE